MRKILLLVLFFLLPCYAFAVVDPYAISVTASVNKTSLTTQEELRLTVIIDGAMIDSAPQLPSLPGFNIYGPATTTEIRNFHTMTIFDYVMLPRFPGTFVIGPITVTYRNKTYQTEPITVTVYRVDPAAASGGSQTPSQTIPAAPSKPALKDTSTSNMTPLERNLYQLARQRVKKDYFLVAAVDNNKPYTNQLFSFVVRFYYAKPFLGSSVPYTAPVINNLFLEETNRTQGEQVLQGKLYEYIEICYAASGVAPGSAEIGSASITYVPANARNVSLFDRMLAVVSQQQQESRTIESNPVKVTIQPVPEQDQPKSFYGAVGSGYNISAELDHDQVEAGEAVNLTVKVNGSGNLKATSDLRMPNLNGLKTYDVVAASGSKAINGKLQSYKIFKMVLVPLSSGDYTLPALAWSYYDPSLREYRTLYTQPFTLHVLPSSKVDSGFDFTAQSDIGKGFTALGKDIHYLKTSLPPNNTSILVMISQFPLIVYLALAWLILAFWRGILNKNHADQKRSMAKLRTQIKQADSEEALAEALSRYVQLTYGVHTGSLTLRDIEQELTQKGCPAEQIQQLSTLWQQLDTLRFAPVSSQGEGLQDLRKKALQVIKAMDKGERK